MAVEAFHAAGDPERYPEAGEPWQPLKLYYHHGHNRTKIQALHDAMVEHDLESPYAEWLENWTRDTSWEDRVTTRVVCDEYFGVRDQALMALASSTTMVTNSAVAAQRSRPTDSRARVR